MRRFAGFTALFCLAVAAPGQAPKVAVTARVLTQPPMSPEAVASAEAALAANPDDLGSRMRLLTHYRESSPIPPHDDPGKRTARLRHITWLIEHRPAEIDAASPLLYVFRSGGPYANAADHELARGLWMRQAAENPDERVVVNAARFLAMENKQEAYQLLRRPVDADPSSRRLAANLGFLYAAEIIEETHGPALTELENYPNALVLAGAATALPNLAMRSSRGQPVDPELFQLASRLMAKARAMAPADEALRGPMPLIEYFQEAQGLPRPAPASAAAPENRIRVGYAVQRAKLIQAPQPKYPELAQKTGIEGDVRFDAVIGPDGAILALTTLAGHPLLVPAAVEAVKQWRFQPTLLNGNPVEVSTDITVSFPPR